MSVTIDQRLPVNPRFAELPTVDPMADVCLKDKNGNLSDEHLMDCLDIQGKTIRQSINKIGILFENDISSDYPSIEKRKFFAPRCFVDLNSVLPALHNKSKIGILSSYINKLFILPLVTINQNPECDPIFMNCYKDFTSYFTKKAYREEVTYIAQGVSGGLSNTCFILCREILNNGKYPDVKKMKFLVDVIRALGCVAQSASKYSKLCHDSFVDRMRLVKTLYPFQSIILSEFLNEPLNEEFIINIFAKVICDIFAFNGHNVSYIKNYPIVLIGMILIVPMLMNIGVEYETHEIISTIVRAVNVAIIGIVNKIDSLNLELSNENDVTDATQLKVHLQNKAILNGFAKATKAEFIRGADINMIYDAALLLCNGKEINKNIAHSIGVNKNIDFINKNVSMTLKSILNECTFPVIVASDNRDLTVVSSSLIEYTGISLRPGGRYLIEANPLSYARTIYAETSDDIYNANFRITAGTELCRGTYPVYSAISPERYYDPLTKKIINLCNGTFKFDPLNKFIITSDCKGLQVTQNDVVVFRINNCGDKSMSPLISFKMCTIKITLIEKISLEKTEQDDRSHDIDNFKTLDHARTIDSCLSLTEKLSTLEDGFIVTCLSLSDRLHNYGGRCNLHK